MAVKKDKISVVYFRTCKPPPPQLRTWKHGEVPEQRWISKFRWPQLEKKFLLAIGVLAQSKVHAAYFDSTTAPQYSAAP